MSNIQATNTICDQSKYYFKNSRDELIQQVPVDGEIYSPDINNCNVFVPPSDEFSPQKEQALMNNANKQIAIFEAQQEIDVFETNN